MARLQDFPSVTPTSSDNLLIVQSQGQGLANFGTVMGTKMDKANPTGTGSLSLNRKANTTVGSYSVAVGYNCEASSNQAYAEGNNTVASGTYAHAQGWGTIANHRGQTALGEYNTADTSTAAASSRGNYIEVVGKGSSDSNRSNARTLDWSGNEVLAGGLKINSTETITALKSSSVTMSSTATSGQYASDLDWSSYRIVNAWIASRACQILVRPSLQNKVVFNIYEMKQVSGIYVFQPITDSSITVNFFYL